MRENEQTAPMHRLVRRLRDEHGFRLEEAAAIELFARSGDLHTVAYAPLVRSLEAWEVDERYHADLVRNLPDARVRIVDTWREIKLADKKYGFVVVDTPSGVYGEHCEHFGLLPDVLRVAADECVVVLGVNVEPYDFERGSVWWRRRAEYYGTDRPEKLERPLVARHYIDVCAENGVEVEWYFFQRRHHYLEYFVMGISRG